MPSPNRANQLLDHAQRMIQERGFNAFSYKDLAAEVGIRTASIHYHFQTKADLGQAVMLRYLEELNRKLSELDNTLATDRQRLQGFVEIYRNTAGRKVVCLCGSLASDILTLTPTLQNIVQRYLERSETWVRQKIEDGKANGEFSSNANADELAASLVAGLQGALIIGRARTRDSVLKAVESSFFKALEG